MRTLKDVTLGGLGSGYFGIFEGNNMGARNVMTKGQLPLDVDHFTGPADVPALAAIAGLPIACEQGMMLVYDEANGVVRKPITGRNDKLMIHYSEVKLYGQFDTLKSFALFPQRQISAPTYTIPAAYMNRWGEITDPEGAYDAVFGSDNANNRAYQDMYTDETPFPRLYPAMPGDVFTTNTVVVPDALGTGGTAVTLTGLDRDAFEAAIQTAIESTDGLWGVPVTVTGPADPNLPWGGYLQLSTTRPANALNMFKAVLMTDLPDGQPAIRFEVW